MVFNHIKGVFWCLYVLRKVLGLFFLMLLFLFLPFLSFNTGFKWKTSSTPLGWIFETWLTFVGAIIILPGSNVVLQLMLMGFELLFSFDDILCCTCFSSGWTFATSIACHAVEDQTCSSTYNGEQWRSKTFKVWKVISTCNGEHRTFISVIWYCYLLQWVR